jgi:succinate dehydrogenase hydrophobic anchor subunit
MESKPVNFSTTLRWFTQSALGVLLLILLGIHLVANHLVAPHGLLNHADVVNYYDVPGIAMLEVIFLIVVTAHCLLGVHAIMLDLALSSATMRVLAWMLLGIGLVIVAYGIRLTWIVASL